MSFEELSILAQELGLILIQEVKGQFSLALATGGAGKTTYPSLAAVQAALVTVATEAGVKVPTSPQAAPRVIGAGGQRFQPPPKPSSWDAFSPEVAYNDVFDAFGDLKPGFSTYYNNIVNRINVARKGAEKVPTYPTEAPAAGFKWTFDETRNRWVPTEIRAAPGISATEAERFRREDLERAEATRVRTEAARAKAEADAREAAQQQVAFGLRARQQAANEAQFAQQQAAEEARFGRTQGLQEARFAQDIATSPANLLAYLNARFGPEPVFGEGVRDLRREFGPAVSALPGFGFGGMGTQGAQAQQEAQVSQLGTRTGFFEPSPGFETTNPRIAEAIRSGEVTAQAEPFRQAQIAARFNTTAEEEGEVQRRLDDYFLTLLNNGLPAPREQIPALKNFYRQQIRDEAQTRTPRTFVTAAGGQPVGQQVSFRAGEVPRIGLFQRIANREPIGQPRSISRLLGINIPSGQSLQNLGRTGRQFFFGQAPALGVPAGEFEEEVERETRGFAPLPRFRLQPRGA